MTALGEGTRPQSVAEAVHFLAEAVQITGQVLTVDDGQHLLPLARDVMFAVEA
ncbi:short chain dehydrogenase [compost metagenome]